MTDRATSAEVDQGRGGRAASVRGVVDELGDWSVGTGPLVRRLAVAFARAVERGAVPHGSRLPSERALAGALDLSRGTVVAAYDQLVADGLVERRRGSGTFATASSAAGLPAGREGSALVARLVDRGEAVEGGLVDLSISVLHDATGLPEVGLTTADLATATDDTGYAPWGRPGLRRAVADLLTRWGLRSTVDQVVITTGAQQALSLAAACWVRPGDRVVLDDPTYPGALSAFTAAGAVLEGLPTERGAPRPEDLDAALVRHPSLVYLQTTLHSPTGAVVSRARREALMVRLAEARVPVVEDVALAGLAWGPTPAPMAATAEDHPVAVVGSLSKLLWGGLRLGFVRAPEPVALRFTRVKATHDLGTSVPSQVLAERLLAHPGLDPVLAARRRELRSRYRALTAALAEHLPDWSWVEPEGGLSLWVRLPAPVAPAFAQVALRHGVAVASAEALSPGGGHQDRIRLSFAAPASELVEGVDRLARAWAVMGPVGGGYVPRDG